MFTETSTIILITFLVVRQTEAVARRCSVKKVLLKFSLNLQEKFWVRVFFLVKLQFCGIYRNTSFMEHLRWLLLDKVLVRYLALLKHLIFMIKKIYCQFLVCSQFQHSLCCYVFMAYYIKCSLELFNDIVLVSYLKKSLTFTVIYHYAFFPVDKRPKLNKHQTFIWCPKIT